MDERERAAWGRTMTELVIPAEIVTTPDLARYDTKVTMQQTQYTKALSMIMRTTGWKAAI